MKKPPPSTLWGVYSTGRGCMQAAMGARLTTTTAQAQMCTGVRDTSRPCSTTPPCPRASHLTHSSCPIHAGYIIFGNQLLGRQGGSHGQTPARAHHPTGSSHHLPHTLLSLRRCPRLALWPRGATAYMFMGISPRCGWWWGGVNSGEGNGKEADGWGRGGRGKVRCGQGVEEVPTMCRLGQLDGGCRRAARPAPS